MATVPAGAVDWDVVKAQLDSIDDAWKQPRFDSLPHVVEVITSPDIEEAVEKLREQRDTIEELVDDVVRIYHNGFNKAIHNYSQILRVFRDSAGSLDGLKLDLGEARKLLGARHKQLQQQWSRSVTLRHVISLLDQIDKVAQVPARIERLAGEKRYYAAVQLHLQSISMLDREGIQTVGALQDVRSELAKLRGVLFFKVVEDLHLHLYNKGEYSLNLAITHEKDDDISNIVPAMVPAVGNLHPVSRRTRTLTRNSSQILSMDRAPRPASVDGLLVDGELASGSENLDGSSEGLRTSANGNDDFSSKEGKHVSRVPPIWLADAIPNDFTESILKSEAPSGVKYLRTMAECLSLLDKIAAGGAIISQRLRPTVHELITSEIKARGEAIEASRPRVDQVQKLLNSSSMGKYLTPVQKNGKNGSSLSAESGPMGKIQTAAQELLESVLALVLQILENHVVVGEIMEGHHQNAQIPNGHGAWAGDSDMIQSAGGYSLGGVLTVIQSECQQLICDILRATPDAASADAAAQTARLASKAPPSNFKHRFGSKVKEESNGGSEEGLSFAFRFTDTLVSPSQSERMSGDSLRHGRSWRTYPGSQEGYGTGAVLSERGIYLTSAVYRPVLQFTDKVASLLPQKYTSLANDGLQSFIENFVKNQFLPIVHVDYRSRVADALASPAAFRLKAHPGAVYETSVEKGRPVLQGPMAANLLVTEVLGWAQAMPMYASEILELVQTLLDRTLERCRAVYTEYAHYSEALQLFEQAVLPKYERAGMRTIVVDGPIELIHEIDVLGSLSSTVIGRPDISRLMKQEPANQLLEATYLSQLGLKVMADAPVDMEGVLETEMEMNNLLLSLRLIRQEQLIADNHKLVLLAALSDSLDFVSDCVQQLGQHNTTSPSPGSFMKRRTSMQQSQVRHRRTSSALTAGLGVLAEKYRLLSTECLRTLRVEMQLNAIYQLQSMAGRVYLKDQDAEEPEDFIAALTTQIARIDEEMTAYVPTLKRSYIFGGICGVSAAAFIKAVNDMESINMLGVRQISRNCIALQQALASLATSSGEFLEERLDRVRTYYELFNLPFEALLALVPEHDAVFSFSEYSALLEVSVPGRDVPPNAVQQIGKILAPMKSRG